MRKFFAILMLSLAVASGLRAQTDFGGVVRLDRTIHDFGDVTLKDGPLKCSFTITNISGTDLTVTSVVSSCGCTGVKWTREALSPGASGKIEATYSNDEGAYPFDKTLTVYVTAMRRPVILHLRGVVHDRKKPLAEMFPVRIGQFGLKSADINAGTLSQGETRSGTFTVANLGKNPASISFKDVSDGLVLVSDGPVAPGSTGKIRYTVSADRSRWGRNEYGASLVSSGKVQGRVSVAAATKENFSGWDKARRDAAASPYFDSSTWSFDPVGIGARFVASFRLANKGKSDLVIYKMETDNAAVRIPDLPAPLPAGKKTELLFNVDTKGLPAGEQLYMITLYTNAPLRPVINLFVAGFLK